MITKRYLELLASINRKGDSANIALKTVGFDGVKQAYNGKPELAQACLDTLIEGFRVPLYQWFKKAGLNIEKPGQGSARYLVLGVVSSKKQAKAFEFCKDNDVIEQAVVLKPIREEKPLEGTGLDRARKALETLSKRLKAKDIAACMALNDLISESVSCVFDTDGNKVALTPDETMQAIAYVTELRVTAQVEKQETAARNAKAVKASQNPDYQELTDDIAHAKSLGFYVDNEHKRAKQELVDALA